MLKRRKTHGWRIWPRMTAHRTWFDTMYSWIAFIDTIPFSPSLESTTDGFLVTSGFLVISGFFSPSFSPSSVSFSTVTISDDFSKWTWFNDFRLPDPSRVHGSDHGTDPVDGGPCLRSKISMMQTLRKEKKLRVKQTPVQMSPALIVSSDLGPLEEIDTFIRTSAKREDIDRIKLASLVWICPLDWLGLSPPDVAELFELEETSGDPRRKKGIQERINRNVVGEKILVTGRYNNLWNVKNTSMQVYRPWRKAEEQFPVSVPIKA